MKQYKAFQKKRGFIQGKTIVGIDPANDKHQGVVINEFGLPMGNSFHFPVSFEGYTKKLWHHLETRLDDVSPESVVFAVETACSLWQTLCHYLYTKGYTVVLVSPLSTKASSSSCRPSPARRKGYPWPLPAAIGRPSSARMRTNFLMDGCDLANSRRHSSGSDRSRLARYMRRQLWKRGGETSPDCMRSMSLAR